MSPTPSTVLDFNQAQRIRWGHALTPGSARTCSAPCRESMSPYCPPTLPRRWNMDRFVVISGCSGGGKSTLLAELARRGQAVVEEPGRRIVREERAGDGAALPWVDPAAFARRAVAMALADREAAERGRLAVLRPRPGRRGRRARARDGRSRAGAARPRPSLSPAGVPGPALAGNPCQRPRTAARLRGGASGVRAADRGLCTAGLRGLDPAQGRRSPRGPRSCWRRFVLEIKSLIPDALGTDA
jgi:hypothetical protein